MDLVNHSRSIAIIVFKYTVLPDFAGYVYNLFLFGTVARIVDSPVAFGNQLKCR